MLLRLLLLLLLLLLSLLEPFPHLREQESLCTVGFIWSADGCGYISPILNLTSVQRDQLAHRYPGAAHCEVEAVSEKSADECCL